MRSKIVSQHHDMPRVLGDQQYAFAALMASEINDEIDTRVVALQQIAQTLAQLANDAIKIEMLPVRCQDEIG